VLSFLTYQRWEARVRGLEEFRARTGLTTSRSSTTRTTSWWTQDLLHRDLPGAAFRLGGGVSTARAGCSDPDALRPLPYIANTADGSAEVGRQPWLIYGLMRTHEGYSTNVSAGNALSL
jgi:cytochrome d ubiquinol oxidase subunit I